MALPPMIQASLNAIQGMQQYASRAISEEDMRQLAQNQARAVADFATPQTTLSSRMDQALSTNGVEPEGVLPQNQPVQFTASLADLPQDEARALSSILSSMGIGGAYGVIGDQIVDQQGRPIAGAPSYSSIQPKIDQTLIDYRQGAQAPATDERNLNIVQSTPKTGLIGSEEALQSGLAGATGAMMTGAEIARGDITNAAQQAQRQLAQGRDQVTNVALTANEMAQQGLASGRSDIMNQVAAQQAAAAAPLQPYMQQGGQAAQLQAALSGALGGQAQQEAYNQFKESPGQAFLREQAERGLLRNQAAIGGIGGGRVREELQRQAMGLAQQDFGNYYNRLSGLAGQGLQAGGQAASLLSGLGGQGIGQLGSSYTTGAGITGNLGSNLMGQIGSNQQLGAQMTGQAGQSMGNIAQQTGVGIGQNMLGTGQQIAADRLLTGQQLAQNIGGTSTALANLANQYGMSVSDLLGATGGNLANLLSGTGAQIATGQQNLGTTLSNIYMGQGSQAVGLPGVPGVQQTQSGLQQAAGLAGALGGLASGGAALLAL